MESHARHVDTPTDSPCRTEGWWELLDREAETESARQERIAHEIQIELEHGDWGGS